MRVIIAGGRDYKWTQRHLLFLDEILEFWNISEVVSGGASGADEMGEIWASTRMLRLKVFEADWSKHGKGAGPVRNGKMAKYADGLILFTGGRGTESMLGQAQKHGLRIIDVREVPG